jgi:hypothetical protein
MCTHGEGREPPGEPLNRDPLNFVEGEPVEQHANRGEVLRWSALLQLALSILDCQGPKL